MLRIHIISIQPVQYVVLPEIKKNAQRSSFKLDYNQDQWRRNPFGGMSPTGNMQAIGCLKMAYVDNSAVAVLVRSGLYVHVGNGTV